MFSVPDAISVRNPVLFKIGILMISTMKSNKPRVLVSGVGTRFGGTETVVSRYIGALSEKYAFDTISSRPYQQVEYSMGDNRIINIPGWKENPIEHITRLRRLFYGHGTEYCAFWHNANSYWNIETIELAAKANIPVRICHYHCSQALGGPAKRFSTWALRKHVANLSNVLLACSQEAGEYAFPGHTFDILNNAFDVSLFSYQETNRLSVRAELGLRDSFVIGHVGRLSSVKNQILLVRSLPEIIKFRANSMLVLVGEGPSKELIMEEARSLGVENHLVLTGPRMDVASLLSAFDVFAFPSVFEGLGMAAVEAQANGLPCVISDQVPRAVAVSDSVCFLPPENPSLWADTLCAFDRSSFCLKPNLINRFDINKESLKLAEYFKGSKPGFGD